jgi:hypothetical protein
MTGGPPRLRQENFKMKISAPTPNLTGLQAAVSKGKAETVLRET